MKKMFNLTTSSADMERFETQNDLLKLMDGFDGVELMYYEEDTKNIIPKERVIGVHLHYYPYWLDFWNNDEEALIREFGTLDVCEKVYGSRNREIMIERFRQDLQIAHEYHAEYVVFHTTDARIEETFTGKYHHTNQEVIDGVIEVVNEMLKYENGDIVFLVENLWQPGFTFTHPDMTKRLLDGITYKNKGIMLDTGHLLHTNNSICTQEEGVQYINQLLDAHGELCKYIRGIHLNQSLTGAYVEKVYKNPPQMAEDYQERLGQMFWHAFAVDQHLPFTCEGVDKLIKRINPEYLTFEFITADSEQHMEYLTAQRKALNML